MISFGKEEHELTGFHISHTYVGEETMIWDIYPIDIETLSVHDNDAVWVGSGLYFIQNGVLYGVCPLFPTNIEYVVKIAESLVPMN